MSGSTGPIFFHAIPTVQLQLRGHRTESHQICTRCTEMIADYSAKIKIVVFQFVWKRQLDELEMRGKA